MDRYPPSVLVENDNEFQTSAQGIEILAQCRHPNVAGVGTTAARQICSGGPVHAVRQWPEQAVCVIRGGSERWLLLRVYG